MKDANMKFHVVKTVVVAIKLNNEINNLHLLKIKQLMFIHLAVTIINM